MDSGGVARKLVNNYNDTMTPEEYKEWHNQQHTVSVEETVNIKAGGVDAESEEVLTSHGTTL